MLIFDHNWLMFLTRPVVVTLFVITAAGLFAPATMRVWRFARARA